MTDRLYAVSPLDGRYADRTEPLVPYASEAAIMRARVRVEVDYLIALADLEAVPLTLSEDERSRLRSIYGDFDRSDAELIKQIETNGTDDIPATNHDVKAVEYFLRDRTSGLSIDEWIHFGLTSEDANNLAYRLLVKGAVTDVLRPQIEGVADQLSAMASQYRSVGMLSRTHGQPATPTTFGKELAVYAARLERALDRLDASISGLGGKLAGATGTYAAHTIAFPDVNWPSFAATFVTDLGLEHVPLVTQTNAGDDLAAVFDALAGVNAILVDLDRDMWYYISQGYLAQDVDQGTTGSSTMPHKINPIDFENSEGNLEKASADLRFLADRLPISRLQRDLSDSTLKRTIGGSLAHCLIGYTKVAEGLDSVIPDEEAMAADLEANPQVLAEAIQTVLRAEGHPDAYERVKALTTGTTVTKEDLRSFVDTLDLSEEAADRLRGLEPGEYTGLAEQLVDEHASDG